MPVFEKNKKTKMAFKFAVNSETFKTKMTKMRRQN